MSAHSKTGAEYTTIGIDATDVERYAEIRLESGEVLVYDKHVEDAWIQSEISVDLTEMA